MIDHGKRAKTEILKSFGSIGSDDVFMKSHQFAGIEPTYLLKAIAAVGGAAIFNPFGDLLAQSKKGRTTPGRIDVHHHMLPPSQPSMTHPALHSPGFLG